MATAEDYAYWIVNNQDKAGTPEFQKVAEAYRIVRGMPVPAAEQPSDLSRTEQFIGGIRRGAQDVAMGIGQAAGMYTPEEIDASRAKDAAITGSGWGKAGQVLGTIGAAAPAMLIPGANTVVGAGAIGAGLGALAPVGTDESRGANAIMGALGGTAGGAIGRGLSRVLNPQTAPEVTRLLEEGVELTPGQTLGGIFRRTEEAAKSVPFLGQGIRNVEARGLESFNRAALNRVLEPIGGKATKIGHEGLTEARELVSKAYDDALSGLKMVAPDTRFNNELARVRSMADTLPDPIKNQLENIIKTQINAKLTPAGTMSADTFKQVTSELGRLGQGYKSAANSFDQNQLGDAILALKDSLNDLAGRANPSARAKIRRADKAYSLLLRVEDAASRAQDGIFTPGQLSQASRRMDRSRRRVASAQGRAEMQDLAQDARSVLPGTLGDSGTAERAMIGAALTGGAVAMNPSAAAAIALARGLYSRPAQAITPALLTKRPDVVREAGNLLGRLPVGPGAAGYILNQDK